MSANDALGYLHILYFIDLFFKLVSEPLGGISIEILFLGQCLGNYLYFLLCLLLLLLYHHFVFAESYCDVLVACPEIY